MQTILISIYNYEIAPILIVGFLFSSCLILWYFVHNRITKIWSIIGFSLLILGLATYFVRLVNVIEYLDRHQGLLTVLGWIAVLVTGVYLHRKQVRDTAKMKVYEEISSLKETLDEMFIYLTAELNTGLSIVFQSMDSVEKGVCYDTRFKYPYEYWHEHTGALDDKINAFNDHYHKFWIYTDTWMSVMPELERSKKILNSKISEVENKLRAYRRSLFKLDVTKWKEWKDDVIKQEKCMGEEVMKVVGYLDDFIGLVHNRLISPSFGYKRRERDLSHLKKEVTYSVLTEKGIEERKWVPLSNE